MTWKQSGSPVSAQVAPPMSLARAGAHVKILACDRSTIGRSTGKATHHAVAVVSATHPLTVLSRDSADERHSVCTLERQPSCSSTNPPSPEFRSKRGHNEPVPRGAQGPIPCPSVAVRSPSFLCLPLESCAAKLANRVCDGLKVHEPVIRFAVHFLVDVFPKLVDILGTAPD